MIEPIKAQIIKNRLDANTDILSNAIQYINNKIDDPNTQLSSKYQFDALDILGTRSEHYYRDKLTQIYSDAGWYTFWDYDYFYLMLPE